MKIVKRIIYGVIALLVLGMVIMGFMPQPVEVDLATVAKGNLRVTVDEDGKTRIRERYQVLAPISGRLSRVSLKAGDEVVAGETLLATIQPSNPELLDARARQQAEARVKASEASLQLAAANLEQAQADLELAAKELKRAKELFNVNSGNLSQKDLDAAVHKERVAREMLRAAEFSQQVRAFELEQAKAALLTTSTDAGERPESLEIRAPISGRVLRVERESAGSVMMGAMLLELGDPADLEIEVDVLTSDAVRIQPGAKVILEHWGGDEALQASVRLIEPAAFTKISALGVEEQRVWVIARFDDPYDKWKSLGDAYRVEARIVVWERAGVIKVPAGALFRRGEDWAVFVKEGEFAKLRTVEAGHGNGLEMEITSGLNEGDQVIVHPSDRVMEGVEIVERKL